MAGAFWLIQTLNNDYDTEISIPLKLKNVPQDVVIISPPPAELKLRVKDKGTVLLNYFLGKTRYPVTIDFDAQKASTGHAAIVSAQLNKAILSQLNASTQLLATVPDTIQYYFSKGTSKKVPVKLHGKLRAGREYYLPDTVFSPDSVLVYAPAGVIDTITMASTEWIELDDVTDTIQRELRLVASTGVKYAPQSVNFTLPVDIYTEKTVEVPIQGINFPVDRTLRAFPPKVQLVFQVGLSRFKDFSAKDFHIFVDYEELLKSASDKYTVKVSDLPQGVNHVRVYPAQVDFLIEQTTSVD